MGRTAAGVKGMNIDDGYCICIEIVQEESIVLIITEKGYGKQTRTSNFRQTKRGSKGVKALNITEKNGTLIAIKIINGNQDLIIMTNTGMTMRMPISQISLLGRATQGVRLINLKDNQKIAAVNVEDHFIESNEESV